MFNFKVHSLKERKCDALPRYNIIQMTLYRDKIKNELDNFKKVNKEGRMTLDDDFTTFPGRGELLSDHITHVC